MEKFPKLFIKASIYYLIAGATIGVLMGTRLAVSSELRFVHIHANLLGFISMMIFGVAYHILPRFNARPLKYPNWVPVHFYLMNIGLVGLLIFYMAGGYWGSGIKSILLGFFSIATGISILMFAINILSVLIEPQLITPMPAPSSSGKEENKIPSSVPLSVSSNPPFDKEEQTPSMPDIGNGKGIKKGEKCSADVMIGKLLEIYPETRKVFAKHYGESCFTCPGQAYETVDQTASMHGLDVNIILKDINEEIEKALNKNQ
jgi:cytochrome c oxidase cbb3-type subunit 1